MNIFIQANKFLLDFNFSDAEEQLPQLEEQEET